MNVVRLPLAVLLVLAASACGAASPTAPRAPAGSGAVHRNEGFLGSGNSVPRPPPPPDTATTK
ncbi:MAG: hypothetical protein JWM27_1228 [Gemmatimonadetes bacterium]|nr:hypothetical protein [Gemmatimonadota bacterium]